MIAAFTRYPLEQTHEDGTANWRTASFIIIYTVVVIWVVLEVGMPRA